MGFLAFVFLVINSPQFWEFLLACLIIGVAASWPFGSKNHK